MSLLLRLARQWIAGETAADGVERVRKANSRGVLGLLNLLGEHIETKEGVDATVKEYLHLLDLIEERGVESQISIKPTQFGLNINFDYCLENYLTIANACKSHRNSYVWIDMENAPYTQQTIELYVRVLSNYINTGIAVQSYLKRSEEDLRYLIPLGSKIRLVKGAYNEDQQIAFRKKKDVNTNYSKLLNLLFNQSTRNNFVAVATHDSKLIDEARMLAKEYPSVRYEFEMLMGVRDKLKSELVSEGKQVREYVPYGPKWRDYSIRRIKEKKSNILLLARSLFVQ